MWPAGIRLDCASFFARHARPLRTEYSEFEQLPELDRFPRQQQSEPEVTVAAPLPVAGIGGSVALRERKCSKKLSDFISEIHE
jgi:hypothetical protein